MAIRFFKDAAAATEWLVSLGYSVPMETKTGPVLYSPERRAVAFVSTRPDGYEAGTLLSSERTSKATARRYDAAKGS